MQNATKDAVARKDVPFGVLKIKVKSNILTPVFAKKHPFWGPVLTGLGPKTA